MLSRQERFGPEKRVLGDYLLCTGSAMAHRRTSGQRGTSTAECHRQTPNEGALSDGADDPDEHWPGHLHSNSSQARPFQASRNKVNDKVSPKSQTSSQTIDKPAAQSVTNSAKSGNKSMLSTHAVNSTFRTQRAAFNSNSDVAVQGQLGSG